MFNHLTFLQGWSQVPRCRLSPQKARSLRGGISESFSEEVFPYLMNNLV